MMPDWSAVVGDMTALQLILWIGAILFLLGLVVKTWPLLRNSVRIAEALLKLPKLAEDFDKMSTDVKRLAQSVDDIHHETRRNDGSSIKDATVRMEESLESLHKRINHLHAVDQKQLARFEKHLAWANDVVTELRGANNKKEKES